MKSPTSRIKDHREIKRSMSSPYRSPISSPTFIRSKSEIFKTKDQIDLESSKKDTLSNKSLDLTKNATFELPLSKQSFNKSMSIKESGSIIPTKVNETPIHNEKSTPEQTKEEIEKARVAKDIEYLMTNVKCLSNYYKLVDKIGEGSFSTVYKARDLRRNLYCNDDWEPILLNTDEIYISPTNSHTNDTDLSDTKVLNEFVALKHIYHISSPKRIANEIKILRQLKGSKCISPLITAFREQDQIFAVMPYIQHDDFRKSYYDMNLDDVKYYMKSLLTGLQQIHRFNIIHRDIKPNNFLYNIRRKTGFLIDFGLAETEVDHRTLDQNANQPSRKPAFNLFSQLSKPTSVTANVPNTATKLNVTNSTIASLSNKETIISDATSLTNASSSTLPTGSVSDPQSSQVRYRGPFSRTPGYIRNDPRLNVRANRAGTRGFRAPEVLMRVTGQTCAIDVWSAGVILLCLLTGRYPFFLANDEADSIIEIAQIFGYKEIKEVAVKYQRHFSTNIPIPNQRMPLDRLCIILNKERIENWDPEDLKNAIHLLNRCLDLDYTTRITAEQALEHDFFKKI